MLVFPLDLGAFWNRLPISELDLDLGEAVEMSRTSGGAVLTADLGDRLWQGSVTLGRISYAEFGEVEAILNLLRQAGRGFLATDSRRPFPRLDPNGGGLGGAAPVVASLGATARSLTLSGLPPGYWLSSSDWLGLSYSDPGFAPALHQVVSGVQADGSGVAEAVEVTPALRPGLTVGRPVGLIRPAFQAVLIPGSVSMGSSRRGITEGVSFSFTQTLRA